jgi:hypothetical protein
MLSHLQHILMTDTFINMVAVCMLGLSIRLTLTYCDQLWASTYHHTMTYMILPVITLLVTKIIAGNIALSLGMVGALSIVRFRNPVKNSFELVMYFALITIGIAGSVQIIYSVGLSVFIISIIIASKILEKFVSKKGGNLYSFSFAEGQNLNTLEIVLYKENKKLSAESFLVQEIHDNDEKIVIYKFASGNKEAIKRISNELSNIDKSNIKNIQYSYTS